MAFETLIGVRINPSLLGSSPISSSILWYIFDISSMVSAFHVSILLYPSTIIPDPSFIFSIFSAIIFNEIIFCFFYLNAVKQCAVLFDFRLQLIPDRNCKILGRGNFAFHETHIKIDVPVVKFLNNFLVYYLFQDVNVHNKTLIFRLFPFNCNPEDIIMPCLLYTSDAADEEDSVDLGGRRIIKKKN